jgi:hypothetical protein
MAPGKMTLQEMEARCERDLFNPLVPGKMTLQEQEARRRRSRQNTSGDR